jgi:hypothetical protein
MLVNNRGFFMVSELEPNASIRRKYMGVGTAIVANDAES